MGRLLDALLPEPPEGGRPTSDDGRGTTGRCRSSSTSKEQRCWLTSEGKVPGVQKVQFRVLGALAVTDGYIRQYLNEARLILDRLDTAAIERTVDLLVEVRDVRDGSLCSASVVVRRTLPMP